VFIGLSTENGLLNKHNNQVSNLNNII